MSFATIICIEMATSKKFAFPCQSLTISQQHAEEIFSENKICLNINQTIKINTILSIFLNNCEVYLQLLSSLPTQQLLWVGTFPTQSSIKDTTLPLNEEIIGKDNEIIFKFKRNSIEQILKEQQQQKFILEEGQLILNPEIDQQTSNNNNEKLNEHPEQLSYQESDSCNDMSQLFTFENPQNCDYLNRQKQTQLNIGPNNINQMSYLIQNSIPDCPSQNSSPQHIFNNQINSIHEQVHSQLLQQSQQQSSQYHEKEFQDISFQQNHPIFIKSGSTRSKERSIKSAIYIVSQWRDEYEKCKQERVFKDLKEIAEELGFSKKVLDYYYLELRIAEFFSFNFDKNLDNKFGMIRRFNQSQKTLFSQKSSGIKKLPIQNSFIYRLKPIPKKQKESVKLDLQEVQIKKQKKPFIIQPGPRLVLS